MGTTLDRAAGDVSGIEQELNALLLSSRASLPHGLNGRPKAPSDPRAAQYRKELAQGLKHPFRHLYTILACDVKDGLALSEALACIDRLRAMIEAEAAVSFLAKRERPVRALMFRTAKEVNELELAQLRLVDSPASREALADVLKEGKDVLPVVRELTHACELSLAAYPRLEMVK